MDAVDNPVRFLLLKTGSPTVVIQRRSRTYAKPHSNNLKPPKPPSIFPTTLLPSLQQYTHNWKRSKHPPHYPPTSSTALVLARRKLASRTGLRYVTRVCQSRDGDSGADGCGESAARIFRFHFYCPYCFFLLGPYWICFEQTRVIVYEGAELVTRPEIGHSTCDRAFLYLMLDISYELRSCYYQRTRTNRPNMVIDIVRYL